MVDDGSAEYVTAIYDNRQLTTDNRHQTKAFRRNDVIFARLTEGTTPERSWKDTCIIYCKYIYFCAIHDTHIVLILRENKCRIVFAIVLPLPFAAPHRKQYSIHAIANL